MSRCADKGRSRYLLVRVAHGDAPMLALVRELYREYQLLLDSVGCHVSSFQDFEDELADLPGRYAEERGGSLLLVVPEEAVAVSAADPASRRGPVRCLRSLSLPRAADGADAAACVALKRIGDGVAEIKRLYVRPAFRRHGLARSLTAAVEAEAVRLGYRKARLDSLERLAAAVSLYESCGFRRAEPYVHNPLPDAVYMEKELSPPETRPPGPAGATAATVAVPEGASS